MNVKDAKDIIKQFKEQGYSDNEIVYMFSMLFIEDKINVVSLNALINLTGNHLTEDFLKMSNAEQKSYLKKSFGIK